MRKLLFYGTFFTLFFAAVTLMYRAALLMFPSFFKHYASSYSGEPDELDY